mmetsp:Transcript_60460/g.153643  ORF Transcript_60460/g.153643 Transcript_60460/m.153643 type:complete len:230 (+) Transcript_60460:61-750(+)
MMSNSLLNGSVSFSKFWRISALETAFSVATMISRSMAIRCSSRSASATSTSLSCTSLISTSKPRAGWLKLSDSRSIISALMMVLFVKKLSAWYFEQASTMAERAKRTNSSLYKSLPRMLYNGISACGCSRHCIETETSISRPSADRAYMGGRMTSATAIDVVGEVHRLEDRRELQKYVPEAHELRARLDLHGLADLLVGPVELERILALVEGLKRSSNIHSKRARREDP